ncbi:MAG: hypothetical protein M3N68_10400 [Actinomycetota bacterium]|nr:hypothetical protein [Actinomycetota bacterium]
MRLRLGFLVGFGSGYYLGAKAGRERYEEINRTIRKIKRSERFEVATEKAKEMVDLGVEQAKDLADRKAGDGDDNVGTTSPYRPSTPES